MDIDIEFESFIAKDLEWLINMSDLKSFMLGLQLYKTYICSTFNPPSALVSQTIHN